MPRLHKDVIEAAPVKSGVCWLCDPSLSLCYYVECSKANCKIFEGGHFHSDCLESYYKKNKLGHLVSSYKYTTNNRRTSAVSCPVGKGKEREDIIDCQGRIIVVKAQQSALQNEEKRQQRITASIHTFAQPSSSSALKPAGSPPQAKKPKPPPLKTNPKPTKPYYLPIPPDPLGDNIPSRLQPHAIAAPRKRAQQMLMAVGSVPGATELESIPLEPYRAKLWGQMARKEGKLYWAQASEVIHPDEEGEGSSSQHEMREHEGGEQEQAVDGDGGEDHLGDEGEWKVQETSEGAYTKEQAEREGVSIQVWREMGYSAFDLRFAGYTALDLATSGLFSAEELFAGGFSREELAYLDPDLSAELPSPSPTSVLVARPNKMNQKGAEEEDDEISELLRICGL